MDSYYEVEIVVDGALDSMEEFESYESAVRYADENAVALTGNSDDWQIYILPHAHGMGDGDECDCRQYDTDHHPDYSSEDAE